MTIKGQVTIPQAVRDDMGIRPATTEVDFIKDKSGRWYIKKTGSDSSRFKTAKNKAKPTMSTEALMALTRG